MTEHDYRASLEWELGIDPDKPDADKLLALAAVLEYCEGLDRKTAERVAFAQIAKRMRSTR